MISVVINTLNEEKNLPNALVSIKDFADEIVVVDMYSDDNTVAVAKRAGAKVFEHKRTGYVEPARNFAIEKASGDWILILDADEEIPKTLAKKLKDISQNSKSSDYYRIPRKNIIFGKWIKHSRWWPDFNIRFFKKGYVSWNEIIHSIPLTTGRGADIDATDEMAIVHNNYTSIEQFVERLNRYTTHQATMLSKDDKEFEWRDVIEKPVKEFVSRYFQGEGYKDGLHGLVLALLQAFSELVLYLKIWQLKNFEENKVSVLRVSQHLKVAEKEMNYWTADTLIKEKGGFIQKLKRKFRLI